MRRLLEQEDFGRAFAYFRGAEGELTAGDRRTLEPLLERARDKAAELARGASADRLLAGWQAEGLTPAEQRDKARLLANPALGELVAERIDLGEARRAREERAADRQALAEARQAVERGILVEGLPFAVSQRLSGWQRLALGRRARRIAAGDQPDSDPLLLYGLRRLAGYDPEHLAQLDLFTLARDGLDDRDFADLERLQAAVAARREGRAGAADLAFLDREEAVAQALSRQRALAERGAGPPTPANEPRAEALLDRAVRHRVEAEERRTGRPLDRAQLEDLVRELVARGGAGAVSPADPVPAETVPEGGAERSVRDGPWTAARGKTARERVYALTGADPAIDRSSLLPVSRDADGRIVATWPGMALDLLQSLLLPGHVAQGGDWSPDEATRMALDVGALGTGARAARVAAAGGKSVREALDASTLGMAGGKGRSLPTDEASRMARARQMGYEGGYYRGEASGARPASYPGGAHFSRERGYAAGFARQGGAEEPAEFMLRIEKSLAYEDAVTMSDWAELVRNARSRKEAQRLVNAAPIRGAWTVEQFLRLAEAGSEVVLMAGSMAWQLLKINADQPFALLRRAGYDAIDSGRDVLKLGPKGIRLRKAAFDPAKRESSDVLAAEPGSGPAGALLEADDRDRRRP
ncbi:hypothetical protein SAMN06265365_12325 [Tistlia consotensis]|uniref:Uncharacterized protein n=1 Tax=Tistlia consotensis USBA 355 TaxID=560819 RepID=A0A1Y6CH01_9PROT|nr:hypothetical protein [Tistlia consotensis]SMF64706.1 hypothetical protein SAMN05428998_12584 [Tistlia consotensis USBA 355]SNR96889.1 hypothetical protein SAMN06265365_12325 [Tistlia consotensis]